MCRDLVFFQGPAGCPGQTGAKAGGGGKRPKIKAADSGGNMSVGEFKTEMSQAGEVKCEFGGEDKTGGERQGREVKSSGNRWEVKSAGNW